MKREVFAKILVEDKVNNGFVVNTLEKQALEMAYCEFDSAICAESDSDSHHERYINYLINWALEHNDESYKGCSPASFDEFEDCEDEEIEYDIALGINEDEYELDESNGNLLINRKEPHFGYNFQLGNVIRIWFVDEDDNPLQTYRIIAIDDKHVVCEYIG